MGPLGVGSCVNHESPELDQPELDELELDELGELDELELDEQEDDVAELVTPTGVAKAKVEWIEKRIAKANSRCMK